MAVQINPRTAIIAGAGVLVVAGAAAWFFLFQDEPPPPPKPVAKAPASAAKPAPKADAPATPGAAAPKPAATAKPAPIPTDPDKLVTEIIETSGLTKQIRSFATEVATNASAASQSGQEGVDAPDARLVQDIANRHFEADALMADLSNGVKAAYEAERMGRFLELLRQPIVGKMTAIEGRAITREEKAKFAEAFRTSPPSPARQKLILALDELTRNSDLGVHVTTLSAREMVDAMYDGLQKSGRRMQKESRQLLNSQINSAEPQLRSAFRTLLHITYRDVSDEDLAAYVKALENETGRWGLEILGNALRGAIEKRIRPFARDMAQLVVAQVLAGKPAAAKPAAAPEQAEPPKAAPVAAAAPVEPPGYQRPAGIKPLYSRYNDLVTAVVMRDSAAVKELLADGKDPNVRQSDGFTPLMVAVVNGDTAIAQELLSKGAQPNLRTPGGQSALSLAQARNNGEMVQLLQRSGARN
jgi:hypothetical protein